MEVQSFTAKRSTRRSLLRSDLRFLPLQLLPRATYPPERLEAGLNWQADFSKSLPSAPLISLVVVGNGQGELSALFESLSVQSYPFFEVIVVADDTAQDEVHRLFEQFGFTGHVVESPSNAAAVKKAFSLVSGSNALFLSNDKFLHPGALFVLAKETMRNPCDLVYANEAIISANGETTREYIRRSETDRYSLVCRNPFGQALLVSSDIAKLFASDDLFPDSLGAMFWSIAAHVAPTPSKISFLPLALFISNERSYIKEIPCEESLNVVERYGVRIGVPFEQVLLLEDEGDYALRPQPKLVESRVQVIIPFRNCAELTNTCLETLAKQTVAPSLEVTLVDNGSEADSVSSIQATIESLELSASIYSDKGNFNFARLNNFGAAQGDAPFILFLNNDVELTDEGAIEELLRWGALSDVGMVGGVLTYPDGAVQSAGINFAPTRPLNVHLSELHMDVVREVNAVTFAMALVRREAFDLLGGLDELSCPNGFGDALFCHRLREAGYKTLFTPYALAVHHESKSREAMPEELELLELYRAGVPISDLFADFGAWDQPCRVTFAEIEQPPVLRLANRVVQSPRWHGVADKVARRVLKFDRARRTAQ